MLQERVQRRQQVKHLERTVAAMPEYPIYRLSPGRYIIYIAGRGYIFDTVMDACMGQLAARAEWLRSQDHTN